MKSCSTIWTLALLTVGFIAQSASADLLVYEPFAYASTTLTGQGGAFGTTGTWTSNDTFVNASWTVHQEGVASGVVLSDSVTPSTFDGTVDNLPTSGGYTGWNQGGNNMNADIALEASVTASFQPGATTWISYVSAKAWDRNEEHPNLILATDAAPTGSRGDDAGGIGTGLTGFGTGGGPTRNNRTDIYPMFYNVGQYSNLNGANPTNRYDESAFEVPDADALPWVENDLSGNFGAPNIVIMKLQWDADGGKDIVSVASFLQEDTLTEANFDALIASKPNLSSANWADANKPSLDQSQLDTITFMGVKYFVDEIRLATTFDEVVGNTSSRRPGDVNDDGSVNGADVAQFVTHYGSSTSQGFDDGDFDADSRTGLTDLLLLKQNFDPPVVAAVAVPEPSTLVLSVLAIVGIALVRRRKK